MPSPNLPMLSIERLRWFHGAVAGFAFGAAFGAWTASTQAPPPAFADARARPPDGPIGCPDGYAASSLVAPGAPVAGAAPLRFIARCDPRASTTAFSESLEAYWAGAIDPDPRGLARSLREFVHAVTTEGALVPDPVPEPHLVHVGGAPAYALDAGAAYRLPALTVRTWVLPAGGNTLEVTLSTPRDRAEPAAAIARDAIEHVTGLRAFDPGAPGVTGWHVTAACPPGFEDATPPAGGGNPGIYIGRYCLAPDEHGGSELTFAELPARADSPEAVRRLLDLSATTLRALGLSPSTAYGPDQPVHLAGADGRVAVMQLDPPATRVQLHAVVAQSGDATVYGLSVAQTDHADPTAHALETWLATACHARPYDAALLREWKTSRATRTVLVPALLTALLGAAVAALVARKSR